MRQHSHVVVVALHTATAFIAAWSAMTGARGEELLLPSDLPKAADVESGDDGLCGLPVINARVGARLIVRNTRRWIGPYVVRIPGYATSGSDRQSAGETDLIDPYAPFLLRAKPGDTLRIDLVDHLKDADAIPAAGFENQPSKDAADKTINLHTHGLIVRPRPYGPCGSIGDNIFSAVDWKNVAHYRIDIPKRIRGAYLNAPKDEPEAEVGTGPYPVGPYWIHAHVHGGAKPDVLSGQSAFLSIDCPVAAKPSTCPNSAVNLGAEERILALRDIQVLVDADHSPDKVGSQPKPLPRNPPETGFYDRSIAYDPTLCAKGAAYRPGLCYAPSSQGFVLPGATAPSTSLTAVWLFTVNGQLFPSIDVARSAPKQLWRMANMSAVVTYRIQLIDESRTPQKAFKVVSVDGVLAGEPALGAPGDFTLGRSTDELLLMPGSRAEVLVERPAALAKDRSWRLVTSGFATGASGNGDTWPAIDLASVTMKATPAAATAATRMALAPLARFSRSTAKPTRVASAVPANCLAMPSGGYRQVEFAQDQANFMIGPVVDGTTDEARLAFIRSFRHDVPPNIGPHICVPLGSVEIWKLVNNTDELHNFHIHQSKFRLATPGDLVATDLKNEPSLFDPNNVLAAGAPSTLAALAAEALDTQTGAVWHDTIPVPPRKGSDPGHTIIVIPFTDRNQIGTFVYHCHILEHEDGGMMAAVQVFDPKNPTLGQRQDGRPTRLGSSAPFCGRPPAASPSLSIVSGEEGWFSRWSLWLERLRIGHSGDRKAS